MRKKILIIFIIIIIVFLICFYIIMHVLSDKKYNDLINNFNFNHLTGELILKNNVNVPFQIKDKEKIKAIYDLFLTIKKEESGYTKIYDNEIIINTNKKRRIIIYFNNGA